MASETRSTSLPASLPSAVKRAVRAVRAVSNEGVRASLLRAAALRIADRYVRLTGRVDALSTAVGQVERAFTRERDYSQALDELLGSTRLECLDIGARGGPDPEFTDYEHLFRFFLVEGEPEEAAKLRASGHVVIDQLLHDGPGTMPFHVTRVPSKSSILRPEGHILTYFAAGRLAQFDVVKRLEVETTSIAELGQRHEVQFDVVKLDTQGNELHVLHGLGDQRPLVIKCEISMAEIYRGQDLFYELGRHLYDLGYVVFRLDMIRTPTPSSPTFVTGSGKPSVGFPLHGDAFFMPDWTRPAGLEVIAGRDLRWAALALMLGHEQLLHHVSEVVTLPHAAEIRRVLEQLQQAAPR